MMRCGQCNNFIKTYDGEGWCSHPKYSGMVMLDAKDESCQGHGYVKGIEPQRIPPSGFEESQHTL